MVRPSCPVLVIHDDDAYRKSLIAMLDQRNFTVTFAADGDGALELLRGRRFAVVIVGLNLSSNSGTAAAEFLQHSKKDIGCGVLILGEPNPAIRTYAPWADETLLKPVDPAYVAARAETYCSCG